MACLTQLKTACKSSSALHGAFMLGLRRLEKTQSFVQMDIAVLEEILNYYAPPMALKRRSDSRSVSFADGSARLTLAELDELDPDHDLGAAVECGVCMTSFRLEVENHGASGGALSMGFVFNDAGFVFNARDSAIFLSPAGSVSNGLWDVRVGAGAITAQQVGSAVVHRRRISARLNPLKAMPFAGVNSTLVADVSVRVTVLIN